MDIKRFAFPDGSWWDVCAELTYGAKRAASSAVKDAYVYDDNGQPVVGENGIIEIDWRKVDFDAINHALLLHSTRAWSWGSVNDEVFDAVPSRYAEEVLLWINKEYASSPLAGSWPRPPL